MDKEHRMLEARLLQAKGLTQKEIAETIGKSERTVSITERNAKATKKPRKRQ
jgi:transcriptional regulator